MLQFSFIDHGLKDFIRDDEDKVLIKEFATWAMPTNSLWTADWMNTDGPMKELPSSVGMMKMMNNKVTGQSNCKQTLNHG